MGGETSGELGELCGEPHLFIYNNQNAHSITAIDYQVHRSPSNTLATASFKLQRFQSNSVVFYLSIRCF